MSKTKSDQHEAIRDVMNIIFRDEESLFDMEVRLYAEAGEDCLKFSVTDQAYLQKYYETTFTIHSIPNQFVTLFGTLPELYQYIATSYQETLQIYPPDDAKENLIIFFSLMILNKVRKYRLMIESRPLTEHMKEQHNLKKLTSTIEDKRKALERMNVREAETSKSIGIAEREIERLKGEETDLHTRIAAQVELEQIQDNNHKEVVAKKAQKLKEVGQLFLEMLKEGYNFTEAETNQFSKATQTPSERRSSKRMLLDNPQGPHLPELKEELILPVYEPKRKPQTRIQNEIEVLNCEEVQEVINIPNNKPVKTPQKDNKNKESNPESQNRKLRLIDNSDDSISRNAYLCIQKQKKSKDQYAFPKPESYNIQQYFINSQENQKNQENASANIVTVLSSSQEEHLNESTKEMGAKVALDFSQSQNMDKYKLQVIKSKTFIQRTFDDKNFYHIYHRHPIKDKQNMQISIVNISKGDFTFGIMSKEALHVSRLDWTKECICWVGVDKLICNQLKCSKTQQKMETSDLITVAVDCTLKVIYFYLNRKFIHREKIPDKMASQCYFFMETATKGNKVCFT